MKIVKTLILILLFASCKPYVNLTQDIVNKYALTDSTLETLQVYNSKEIVLYNGTYLYGYYIDKGVLIQSETKNNDKVIIPIKTPVIVTKTINDKLLVSFDFNSTGVIVFMPSGGDYNIAALWDGKCGKTVYDKRDFYLTNDEANTFLLIRTKDRKQTKSKTKRVNGHLIK
jgi:hypothetical protein